MESRSRWQALQGRIAAAREALDAGDRARALQEVDAALEIDPGFVAAQALKDRIAAAPLAATPVETYGAPADPAPVVSAERYARFEERARRRRVDRRLDAARLSISERRWKDAAAALDEIVELDPNLPDLAELKAQIAQIRREPDRRRRFGPPIAAAAVFGALLFGASWVEQTAFQLSRPISAGPVPVAAAPPLESVAIPDIGVPVESAPLVAATAPPPPPAPARPVSATPASPPRSARLEEPHGDGATRAKESTVVAAVREVTPPASAPEPVAEPPKPPARPVLPPPAADPSAILPQTAITAPPVEQASTRRPASPAPEPVRAPDRTAPDRTVPPPRPAVDEQALVTQALQRYRAAYEGLDARSAHAVWPAVDEAALARAFDGLESQRLTFDACSVQVGADRAAATCRGTVRYVPKVGSRDVRTEPRTWTFALVKTGPEWKIDAARVER